MLQTSPSPRPKYARAVTTGDGASSPIARQVEIVKQLFEAFSRQDVGAALELLDPDVRFLPVTAHLAREGKAYEGHAGILEYYEDVRSLWQELELVPQEFQAVLGVVVVIGEVRARGPAAEVTAPVVWTWKLRDGLVVECSIHSDLAFAREALGESGPATASSTR
jgi:ketosteroid isomerase-like protein